MATTHYGPEQTRQWSTTELAALIGKTVSISFQPNTARIDTVVDAGIGRRGEAWIEFKDGTSVTWQRETELVTVFVEEA